MKVMLMPLAMAAMFFRTGIHDQYTERDAKSSACGRVQMVSKPRVELRSTDSRWRLFHMSSSSNLFCNGGGGACMLRDRNGALEPCRVPKVEQHLRSRSEAVISEVESGSRTFAFVKPPVFSIA